jgi:trimethylamine--corrinoid protein Co-methyltransferase
VVSRQHDPENGPGRKLRGKTDSTEAFAVVHLTVLDDGELEAVHEATLRILEEVGILLSHPEAASMLEDLGARRRAGRVLIPPDLVERSLASCPTAVSVRGRGGGTAVLGDGSLHWHNLGGARDVFEPERGHSRPATIQDVRDSARLLDALDGATTVTPFFTPQDVPGQVMALAMYRHTLANTVKPIHGPGIQNAYEVRHLARMVETIGRPEECLTIGISPLSPLTFTDGLAGAILQTARLGIPLGPLPCPTAGATAPMSLAGALAQQNAEVLASIVLAQSVRPGLPIFYCGRLAFMEPRSGVSVWGGPEIGLVSAATVQIGHRYHLPVNVYGLSTNALALDLRNGYERSLNAVVPALAGADELSGIGEMASGIAGSFAQMVLDNEIAAGVRRICRGIHVDDDSLAVDLIAAVMDGSRNFLAEEHTVRHLRQGEVLYRKLFADPSGAGDALLQRVLSESHRLLTEHEVPPLHVDQEKELDALLEAASREPG